MTTAMPFFPPPPDSVGDGPRVMAPCGPLRGVYRGHDAVFHAIPYGCPLEGAAAYAAPQPMPVWEEEYAATTPGAPCQYYSSGYDGSIPEMMNTTRDPHQLHLTIYAPSSAVTQSVEGDAESFAATAGLPVFVWFHGGGFSYGYSGSDWWDGAAFTRSQAIVVVPNYRLDVEGWLSLPDAPLNRGLLDQILALQWVRDNIAAFGGDPQRVTIGGQSAGGTSVLALAGAPAAQGLFQQVFSCSPAFIRLPQNEKGGHLRRWAHLLFPFRRLTVDSLVSLPEKEKNRLSHRLRRWHPFGMPFYPVIDEATQPFSPEIVCRQPEYRQFPLLIGSTSEEFDEVVFSGPLSLATRAAAEIALRAAGVRRPQRQRALATHHGDLTTGRIGAIMSDTMIRSTVTSVAEGREENIPPSEPSQTWVYEYRWPGKKGASHCGDLPLWWNNLSAGGAEKFCENDTPTQVLADHMNGALVRFLHTGHPGWPEYTDRTRISMVWDEVPFVESDVYRRERETWL